MFPVDASEKVTVNGTSPVNGVPLNAATGGTSGVVALIWLEKPLSGLPPLPYAVTAKKYVCPSASPVSVCWVVLPTSTLFG